MSTQALSGLRVIDLTHYIAGPYCTKMLADFGADVVKVERPGSGDLARHQGPFVGGEPHLEKSALFLHLNTNKQSVTLNLKTASGRRLLLELVKDADMLVENFRPRVMPSLGLDWDTLKEVNPKLVLVSISNFGQTGPYRDWKASDLIIYAVGHTLYSTGLPDREPNKLAGNVMQYQSGNVAAVAALGAWRVAQRSGQGEHVDVAMTETHMGSGDRRPTYILYQQYTGKDATRLPVTLGALPNGYFPCQDGYIFIQTLPLVWPRLAEMLGHAHWLTDPSFATAGGLPGPDKQGAIDAVFRPWVAARTRRELMETAQAYRVYLTAVQTPADVAADPQFQERQYWATVEHPVAGRLTQTGAPFRMARGGWQAPRPAPLLGQHNRAIFCERLGYSPEALEVWVSQGII